MQTPRWMRFLLIGSLALNLLVLGLVAGAVLRERPELRHAERASIGLGPYPEALDGKRSDAFRDEVRRRAPSLRENRSELRVSFRAVLSELRADPLDREALTEALARQDAALRGRQAIAAEVLIDQIADMSAAERAAFADRLEKMIRRGGRPERD